jgi:hypothetical protein
MAATVTVTIYYKNGSSKTLRVSEKSAIYYENLPFTDTDVERVNVRY